MKTLARRFTQAAVLCGFGVSAFAQAERRLIRTAIGEPALLDPARARTASENAVILQVFSRLLECDASLRLRPSLARASTVAADAHDCGCTTARAAATTRASSPWRREWPNWGST